MYKTRQWYYVLSWAEKAQYLTVICKEYQVPNPTLWKQENKQHFQQFKDYPVANDSNI